MRNQNVRNQSDVYSLELTYNVKRLFYINDSNESFKSCDSNLEIRKIESEENLDEHNENKCLNTSHSQNSVLLESYSETEFETETKIKLKLENQIFSLQEWMNKK